MENSQWEPLQGCKNEAFGHGTVFRCPAKFPYESLVDFLLISYPHCPSGHALVVATGQKAGHLLIALPEEARHNEYVGICVKWLLANWNHWIYEVGPNQVYFKRRYIINAD